MKQTTVEITEGDAVELYHILNSRGPSSLRVKLLSALREIDPKSAEQIDKIDARWQ